MYATITNFEANVFSEKETWAEFVKIELTLVYSGIMAWLQQ